METLALIELLDRDGLPRQVVRVTGWPVRIGRAIDNDVVLDDPHVAAHHATLIQGEGGVHVVPAPSLNGVRFGRSRIAAGSAPRLPPSGEFAAGATLLRVRLPAEMLAPEAPLAPARHPGRHAAWLGSLALLVAAWAAFEQWLSSAPGAPTTEVIGIFLGVPLALGVWCGLWALGSKLFQHQFAFWPHLEVALFWPLVAMLAGALGGQVAFALSLPWLDKAGRLLAAAALGVMLWRHVGIVLPRRRREIGAALLAMAVVGAGLRVAERMHHEEPLVGGLYLDTLSLPQLRMARPVSADAFVQGAMPLEKALSRWARTPTGADTPAGDDDDDE